MSSAASLQNAIAKPQQSSNSGNAGLVLQRKCACGSPTSSLTGVCEECKSMKGLQAKLTIGASNDPLEQEADGVAEQVLAAPVNSAVSGAPLHIQRFTGQSPEGTDTAPASVDRVLGSSGRPLEPVLRQDMEQRFGHDFSRVRVHTGGAAEQSARDVNANAYTMGHNVVFGAGRFAPGMHEGRRLLAHELTHVVQQSGSDGIRIRSSAEGHCLSSVSPTNKEQLRRQPAFQVVPQSVTIGKDKFPPPATLNYDELVKLIHRLIELWREGNLERVRIEVLLPQYLNEVDKILQPAIPGVPRIVNPLKSFRIQMHRGETEASYPPTVRERLIRVFQEPILESYDAVKSDPQYIDNFTNDVKDAWYPNDRVFIFEYPNDTALKIGLSDLLKALSVPSDLNPQPSEAELKKQYKIPEDLELPTSSSPMHLITVGKVSFSRDNESGVVFPAGRVQQAYLPRIAAAVKLIESTRVGDELWQKAAPQLLERITNLEFGAPRGIGALLVSVGKRIRKAARAAGLIKPGPARPITTTSPHAVEPSVPVTKGGKEPSPPPAPVKPATAGAELPESTYVGKGSKPQSAAKPADLDDVANKTLFEGKPQIKKALAQAPRAARALKKCASPCFPENMTPTQIDRLERMLETAENSGVVYSEKKLTDFLRSKDSWKDFEGALDDLEKDLLKKREVLGEFGEAGKQIGGDRVTPEGRPATTTVRSQPGKAAGGEQLPEISGQWFPEVRSPGGTSVPGTRDVRVAPIPGQIARKMRGMDFKTFDDLRESFWKMVAKDPMLKQGWSAKNLARMEEGLAPFVGRGQSTGGGSNAVYQLNHKQAIKNVGEVYNLDNIEVVSPRFHEAIGD